MEPFDDPAILSQSVSRNRPKDPVIKRVFALFLIGMCMMNVSLLHAQERGDIDLRMEWVNGTCPR